MLKEHLSEIKIEHLKEGINLRVYSQKNPPEEYKKDTYHLFINMYILNI